MAITREAMRSTFMGLIVLKYSSVVDESWLVNVVVGTDVEELVVEKIVVIVVGAVVVTSSLLFDST